MRPLWHLTINDLAGRWGRTVLLVLAVALATVLPVGVSSMIGTLTASLGHVVGQVAGLADVRIEHRFRGRFDQSLLEVVRGWPEVSLAAGRIEDGVTLRCHRTDANQTVLLRGVEPERERRINPQEILAGRAVRDGGEVMLDERVRKEFDAKVGDMLEVVLLKGTAELKVVGILARPKLRVLQRPLAVTTLARAQELTGNAGRLDQISIRLAGGADVAEVSEAHQAALPGGLTFRTSASARAGLTRRLRMADLMLYVVTVLASLSSAFLILTSLTTAVTQRIRELAVLRCIGAGRGQLAGAQLGGGLLIGAAGAAVGAPVGLAAAYGLYLWFQDALPGGFHVKLSGLAGAVAGSLAAGLVGAAYPAFLAATARPLEALTVRARTPRRWHLLAFAGVAVALASAQPVVMLLSSDDDFIVWFWARVGIVLAFVGFFVACVPLLVAVAEAGGPLLARAMRVPPTLLRQAVLATPMRHGFTAGALMVSLALLVAIWTQGRSATAGWLDSLKMPDAFVHSFWSLRDEQIEAVRKAPAVTQVCPTAMFSVQARSVQFGPKGLAPPNVLFVGTDMGAFTAMTNLDWVEGDRAAAMARLAKGQAVLVSRDWSVAHGVGVGAKLPLAAAEGTVEFEVVGVIASKGLDLATRFFRIERSFGKRAISSVFGTREDARRHFKVTSANLVLLSLRDDISDKDAVRQLQKAVPGAVAGTSRAIRRRVDESVGRLMAVASAVAVGSLILACCGVANLIVAEVTARRFEFGVLRAIGAQRGLLGRFVAAQTILVALAGGIAGVALGLELAFVERAFHRRLFGVEYAQRPPWDVIAWGLLALIAAALLAGLPAVRRVVRQQPRELLARRE